ncbi:hypothetical protein I2W78_39785 [Streptomyces spinoverrucosus]|nr:hypothetical protein [Streptomyces spinoverrucosus]MBG0857815.1 hypothetical protein [Streptomyces spinoverrucosus]
MEIGTGLNTRYERVDNGRAAPSGRAGVSIWCDRFDVSFGATELART